MYKMYYIFRFKYFKLYECMLMFADSFFLFQVINIQFKPDLKETRSFFMNHDDILQEMNKKRAEINKTRIERANIF